MTCLCSLVGRESKNGNPYSSLLVEFDNGYSKDVFIDRAEVFFLSDLDQEKVEFSLKKSMGVSLSYQLVLKFSNGYIKYADLTQSEYFLLNSLT